MNWQTLVKDAEKLSWEMAVGSLLSKDLKTLQLTLLVEEVPELEPEALLAAIESYDEVLALQLLQRPHLPGLNNVGEDRHGQSVLHRAILCGLDEVAVAIVKRPDFTQINRKASPGDETALHLAAWRSFLPVCRAILGHRDFTERLAVARNGWMASRFAHRHRDVAEYLQAVEAQR